MTETQEFKTPEIEVKVAKKPSCQIEFEIKALPSLLQKARSQALKEVKKEVSLPGFRKGKAPDALIQKKHKADIEKHFQKVLADLAFSTAMRLVKIPLLNNESSVNYHLKEQKENEALLIFAFETEPEVPSVSADNFTMEEIKRPEIGEKEIDEAIRQTRFFYAEWKTITDRPVQEGDFLILDLETLESDPPQKVFSDIRFEIADKSLAQWMKELLIGANAGDVLEGLSRPDDTLSEEEKKEFQPKKVRITVKKIEEAELPPLDEDFAKKLGAPSLADFRKQITELLNRQADEKVEKAKKEAVNKFLLENYRFELPASQLAVEIKHRKNQILQNSVSKAKWEKMANQEKEQVEKELQVQAEEAIRLFYLSRKIVQDAGIEISQEDIDKEALFILSGSNPGAKPPAAKDIPQEVYALAVSKIVLAEAQNYLLNKKNLDAGE